MVGDGSVLKYPVGFLRVGLEGALLDVGALDRVPLHKGHSVASKEVVSCFLGLARHSGVVQLHPVAKLHVVILPGDASTRLLASSGSTYFFVNKVSKMSKVSSAFGWKR